MIRTLKISAAVAIAGAFSVAQAATCPDQSYGAISFQSYGNNKCVAIIDADGANHNEPIVISEDITVDSVYYFRSNATSSSNQTIVLPFDVPTDCFFDDGAQFLEIDKISQDSQTNKWRALLKNRISVQNEGLKANYPYILRFNTHDDKKLYFRLGSTSTKTCQFTFNTSNGAGTSKFSATPLNGTWTLKGTYDKIVFDETTKNGVYGFTSTKAVGKYEVGQFMKAGTGASVSPLRAYLVYNNQNAFTKAAPGMSFAPAADDPDLLPASMEVIEEGDCFQEGDGIFEVRMTNGKKTACIDGKSDARLQTLSIPNDIVVDSVAYNRDIPSDKATTIMLPFEVPNSCIPSTNFFKFIRLVDYGDGQLVLDAGSIQNDREGEVIKANVPYLVMTQNGKLDVKSTCWYNNSNNQRFTLNTTSNGSENVVIPSDSVSVYKSKWEFRGTYENIIWGQNHKDLGRVYGFASNETSSIKVGQFVKAKAGANIPAMRAYLYYNRVSVLAKDALGSLANDVADEDLPKAITIRFIDKDGETSSIGTMNTITGEITMDENKWFDMKGRVLNKKPSAKGTYYNKGQKVIIK